VKIGFFEGALERIIMTKGNPRQWFGAYELRRKRVRIRAIYG